jgi:hypothetical protein
VLRKRCSFSAFLLSFYSSNEKQKGARDRGSIRYSRAIPRPTKRSDLNVHYPYNAVSTPNSVKENN